MTPTSPRSRDAAHSPDPLRPHWRAFVLRPTARLGIAAAAAVAAWYFFHEPITDLLGAYAVAIPATSAFAVLALFGERCIQYRKTSYRIGDERIVVETGTVFRERRVELDLERVTLVEWDSPWILRILYDCGHVTLQEAGSAERPAYLAYVESPGALYEHIGHLMENRGFSMQRGELVRRETPGYLGATVDLLARQFKFIIGAGAVLIETLPESIQLLVGPGPSLEQLLIGNHDVFAPHIPPEAFTRFRIGVVLLGGLAVVVLVGWLMGLFLDLLHRNYTLYDDVLDYHDGWFNETRRFIPLENLSDSQVARPFYKRLFGLSDVTLSSQGAENDVVFRSTPNGPAFAEDVERLLERSRPSATVDSAPESEAPDEPDRRSSAEPQRTGAAERPALELSPSLPRASCRGLGNIIPFLMFVAFTAGPFILGSAQRSVEIGPFEIASLAAVGMFVAVGAAAIGGAGMIWWMGKAWATEFQLDDRGAHSVFDLFSRTDRNFSLERITSVSIVRNPLDWLAGTMTVEFRSIGAEKSIRFWAIEERRDLLDAVRDRLDLPLEDNTDDTEHLVPDYAIRDGLAACAPFYLLVAMAVAAVAVGTALGAIPDIGLFGRYGLVAAGGVVALHQSWRAVYHGRMRGHLSERHVSIEGGIVRRFHHLVPLRHVRSVESRRYPTGEAGRLSFRSPGFAASIGHLPELRRHHDETDRRLIETDGEQPEAETVTANPSAATEAFRRGLSLLIGIGLVYIPYVAIYYARARYILEPARAASEHGLYFDCRETVPYRRIDHIESDRGFAHWFSDTEDVAIFTAGSGSADLEFRSVARSDDLLGRLRARLR